MGSAQSSITPQTTAAALVVAGAIAFGATHLGRQQAAPSPAPASTGKKGKKKKQAGAQSDTAGAESAGPSKVEAAAPPPNVVSFPPVIPGAFDAPATTTDAEPEAKTSKSKKKKAKKAGTPTGAAPRATAADALSDSSATAPESLSARPTAARKKGGGAKAPAVPPVVTEESWTRVEPRRRQTQQHAAQAQAEGSGSVARPAEVSTSDAGATTSVTGNSSPVTERTEDDELAVREREGSASENRKTLAEKLLPKPRKTGVEDMLETPDYPTLSRVMRVPPPPGEKPPAGFSWADYEDVDDSRITADDADGEDDGGWGVVKSRTRKAAKSPSAQTPTQTAPETATKKQRQRAAKRDAEKVAKADAEAERLAALAQHKRALERERMVEQAGKAKKTSGGMSAYVDENGKLVWQ